jgi:3-hydroxyisobutyrate dehydrogenase-like beta-hydroxyacid dehydrogenase
MAKKIIAMLHPGEMGAAVGACLASAGHRVVWASAGRSAATRARAKAAGLEDVSTLARAVGDAEFVFSICPPHGALDLAAEIAGLEFDGLYVDGNAIAPDTAREVGARVEAAHARFVDGGILGPAPLKAGTTRFYLSGPKAKDVAALFKGSFVEAIALDGPVGAASALKVCYAAWNKGSIALLTAVRALAQHEEVDEALMEAWQHNVPEIAKRSEIITTQARKAWRWIGEMDEIAGSFEAAGLPGGFHLAAADIYSRLEDFKDAAKPPSIGEILDAVTDGGTVAEEDSDFD